MAPFQNAVHQPELVSIVESEREFIEIERQVLRGHFVAGSHHATLKKRPDVLDSVRVNAIAGYVGFAVINRPMSELRGIKPKVRLEFVGLKLGTGCHVLANEISDDAASYHACHLEADLS